MPERIRLTVNGIPREIDVAADQALLAVLREKLDLTGAKISCGEGQCGACTVLLDDEPVRACVTPVGVAAGKRAVTIEGLEHNGSLHPLQQAFLDHAALQCGYCTPGMIMSALGFLLHTPDPAPTAIVAAMEGNICRCGSYPRIVQAIQQAASELRAATGGDHGR